MGSNAGEMGILIFQFQNLAGKISIGVHCCLYTINRIIGIRYRFKRIISQITKGPGLCSLVKYLNIKTPILGKEYNFIIDGSGQGVTT
jgi:hypothetical protein